LQAQPEKKRKKRLLPMKLLATRPWEIAWIQCGELFNVVAEEGIMLRLQTIQHQCRQKRKWKTFRNMRKKLLQFIVKEPILSLVAR